MAAFAKSCFLQRGSQTPSRAHRLRRPFDSSQVPCSSPPSSRARLCGTVQSNTRPMMHPTLMRGVSLRRWRNLSATPLTTHTLVVSCAQRQNDFLLVCDPHGMGSCSFIHFKRFRLNTSRKVLYIYMLSLNLRTHVCALKCHESSRILTQLARASVPPSPRVARNRAMSKASPHLG